jgi:myo-inositol-1(or 4)-monophosphatase
VEKETRSLLEGVSALVLQNMERIQETRYDIELKPDGSPVTKSDLFIEDLIRRYVVQQIPDVDFVGEESYSASSISSGRHMALLDPIDGTENFCSGLKEWGVSFALWREGQHLGSMLMLPELGERIMTGDKITPIRSRINGFSSSFSEKIVEAMREVQESRITGCAVYNLYNVVRGSFSRFRNPKGAYSWDLLPGLMLALEHGCHVQVDDEEYNGSFLEPGRKYRIDIQHRYDHHPG